LGEVTRGLLVAGLFSFIVTQACRLLVEHDKRPRFDGRIAAPLWKAPGIAVEQLAACAAPVLLVVGQSTAASTAGNRLFALDAASGRQLWKSGYVPKTVLACGRRSAIVIDSADQQPRLVDLASGKFILGLDPSFDPRTWAVDAYYGFGDTQGNGVVAVSEVGQKVRSASGTFSGTRRLTANADVVVVSDVLVNQNGEWESRATIYDRASLQSLWTRTFGQYADPLLPDEPGAPLFVCDYRVRPEGDGSITYALDARTGSERWRRSDPGEKRDQDGLLGLSGGVLFLQKPWKGYSIARADHDLWRNQTPYFVTGIDPQSGRDLFTTALYARSEQRGGVVASGGLLYSRDHKQYAVLDEAGNASISGWLTCIDPKTGSELWRSQAEDEVSYAPPVVRGELIYAGGHGLATAGVLAFRR
jgi:outer membrane protein assembly factor BamB